MITFQAIYAQIRCFEGSKTPPGLLYQEPLDDNEVAKFSEFSLTGQEEFWEAAARGAFIKGDLLQYLPFV